MKGESREGELKHDMQVIRRKMRHVRCTINFFFGMKKLTTGHTFRVIMVFLPS